MSKVYNRIESITGNVITVRANGVKYKELAQINTRFGKSLAQVNKIDGDIVSLQVFAGGKGVSTGDEVRKLQNRLTELGYLSGAADGNFGTGTQTAVKKFQEDNKLDADGIAGKMTQEMLFKKSSVTPIPETTVGPNDIMDLPG